jgi:hypothetical protein
MLKRCGIFHSNESPSAAKLSAFAVSSIMRSASTPSLLTATLFESAKEAADRPVRPRNAASIAFALVLINQYCRTESCGIGDYRGDSSFLLNISGMSVCVWAAFLFLIHLISSDALVAFAC